MTVTTTIRIPEELHRSLREEAERRGQTLNGYILQLLWRQQEERRKEEK